MKQVAHFFFLLFIYICLYTVNLNLISYIFTKKIIQTYIETVLKRIIIIQSFIKEFRNALLYDNGFLKFLFFQKYSETYLRAFLPYKSLFWNSQTKFLSHALGSIVQTVCVQALFKSLQTLFQTVSAQTLKRILHKPYETVSRQTLSESF